MGKYCPIDPWPKQQAFLRLDCQEAFFGGAAGGGKSFVLLMAAVQHVHVSGYRAIILRKTLQVMKGGKAVLDIAKEWWMKKPGVKFNGSDNIFTFPSGATIKFQQCQTPDDRFLFAGTSYHFIGWDELTEFFGMSDGEQNPYLYCFRSQRLSTEDRAAGVPLRVRSTGNPGNVGHMWVKNRFITDEAHEVLIAGGDGVFWGNGRAFVPSRISDNPALDEEEYRRSLSHLPPVTRERLMNGDWSIQEDSVIQEHWLRYFRMQGENLVGIDPNGVNQIIVDQRNCQRFATIDTAGTSKQKAQEQKGKSPSWSVCMIWDMWSPSKILFLRHTWRARVGFIDLVASVKGVLGKWKCQKAVIEHAHVGYALGEELKRHGHFPQLVPTKLPGMKTSGSSGTGTGGAKLERAVASGLLKKLEAGEIFLPKPDAIEGVLAWLAILQSEWLGWTGMDEETADQVDTASYAANECRTPAGGGWGGVVNVTNEKGMRASW
jgi:hypothetical protein